MNKATNCTDFEALLHDYLDNELDASARAVFLEHTRACAECAEKLESMTTLLTMCAELDEGLVMPLDAQAAWRKAVREEADKGKKSKTRSWIRGVGAVAAAVVLLAGSTIALRMAPLSLSAQDTGTGESIKAVLQNHFKSPETVEAQYFSADSMDLSGGASKGTPNAIAEPDGAMDDMQEYAVPESETMAGEMPSPDEPQTGADLSAKDIKVIRSASRDMETSNYDADLSNIKDLVTEYEGRIESLNEYGQPLEQGLGYGRNVYMSVRIPTDQMDAFLTALDFGTITSRSENEEDISRNYYDVSARLQTQKALRERLNELIAQAESFADLIEGERQLAALQAEIDGLEGTIRGWDSRIQFSQIRISLCEVAERNAVNPPSSVSLGDRIKTGFYDSINIFLAFAQDFVVLLVLIAPELIVLLILVLIVVALVKRHRRRRQA